MFFYLKEPNGDKDTVIIIQYYINDEKKIFKYSTGEFIHPDDWDFSARLPKSKKGTEGVRLRKITSYITQYNDLLIKVVDNLKLNNEKITREKLKKAFDKHFRPDKVAQEFEYFTDFIDDFIVKLPKLINRNTGKPYSKSRSIQYNQANNVLKSFENHIKKRIRICDYNQQMNDKFVDYSQNIRNNAPNTTGEYVRVIKALLNKAKEQGYDTTPDLSKFTTTKEKTLSVALSEDEIERIFNHDFSQNKELENARDLIILGVWTGLRVSDFMNLPSINPQDKFIEVEPQKTRNSSGAKVVIPLHHHIKKMIEERGMPQPIQESTFNKLIKEVCKIVGIDQLVEGSKMNSRTRRKEVGVFPKYQLISSHTCRRSFATNLYLMNFPTLSIMKITGHTTEQSFLSYIKVTPKEHAQKLLEHWENYYSNRNV